MSIPHPTTYKGLPFLFKDWALLRPDQLFEEKGLEGLVNHYKALSQERGIEIPLPESVLNELGYEFMRREKTKDAVTIFKAATDRYPVSPNAWDSLGDAYEAQKDLSQALASYQKAVKLAEEQSHSNLSYFQQNLQRLQQQITPDQN